MQGRKSCRIFEFFSLDCVSRTVLFTQKSEYEDISRNFEVYEIKNKSWSCLKKFEKLFKQFINRECDVRSQSGRYEKMWTTELKSSECLRVLSSSGGWDDGTYEDWINVKILIHCRMSFRCKKLNRFFLFVV